MVSQGEPDRTRKAKDSIVNALVGLVIAIMANVVVAFLGRMLTAGTSKSKDDGVFGGLGLLQVQFTTDTIPGILNLVFAIMGGISVVIIAIAGLKYTLSMGEPSATKKAKDTILYAVIGLFVSILAVAIVSIVSKAVA